MTIFFVTKNNSRNNKPGNIAGLVVIMVLLGFLSIGFIRNLQFNFSSSNTIRKNANTYLAILATNPSSLFLFNKETGKAELYKMDDDIIINGSVEDQDQIRIGDLKNNNDGKTLMDTMTLVFRAKINNYIIYKNSKDVKVEDVKQDFDKFTSLVTPIAIILGGTERGNIKDNNITRIDAIRLWWQLKDLRSENIKITNLPENTDDNHTDDGNKILGENSSFSSSIIQDMSISDEVAIEQLKVNIQNPSKNRLLSRLAAGFINNTGADLRDIIEEGTISDKTVIYTDLENSKTAKYLATIFDCDIKRLPDQDEKNTVLVILGSDFGKTYLK